MDGLRGVAALIVVLCHFVLAFQPGFLTGTAAQAGAAGARLSKTPAIIFWNPEFGVAVFFVLSGLALAASAYATQLSLAALLLRRWIRLAGPVLGSSFLVWIAVDFGLLHSSQAARLSGSAWLDGQFAWVAYQANDPLLMARQSVFDVFTTGTHFWNQALWTMPVEFIGSVGVYFGVLGLRRVAPGYGMLLGAAATAMVMLRGTPYAHFAAGVALFSVSAALAGRRHAWLAHWGGPMLAVGAILAGGMPWALDADANNPYWPVFVFLSSYLASPIPAVHGLGAVLSVACVLAWRPARGLFAQAVPVALGRVSFMIYLCHIVLICTLVSWLVETLTPPLGYNGATAVGLAALLAALMPLAAFMTWVCDLPLTNLSRRAGSMLDRAGRSLLPPIPVLSWLWT